MDTLIANDVLSDSYPVVSSHLPPVPETAAAALPASRPISLPADETGWRTYLLDYFKELGVPDTEASPHLGEIMTGAKKRCEAILFSLCLTGAWERSADWLTLAIRDTALETYIWSQRDSLIQRFRKNPRYWQDAEDIAHDVLSKAIVAIRRGRRPKNKLKHWMSVLARNALIDHHRIESGQPQSVCSPQADDETADRPLLQQLPDPGPSPSHQAICRLTWAELAERRSKEVADACRYTAEGYTQKETAEKCGVTSDRTIRRWLEQAAPTVETLFGKTG